MSAYHKNQELTNVINQEYIEIEFVLESPKVEEKPKSNVYKLSKPISKKEIRSNRKMRRKSYVKINRPEYTFAVAERRISY